jgi:DNA-binding transcriptional LysR family regulator
VNLVTPARQRIDAATCARQTLLACKRGFIISIHSPINRRWLPLNALRAFDAVGQNLSFTGGAATLSVSQSAMSRHVIGLEDMLGKPLFDRSGAKLALTAAGEELLPVVSKCLDRLEQTMNAIRDDSTASRVLRIHAPPTLLQQLLVPMLRDFRHVHPDIRIDVSSTHVTGLPAANLDMAIVFDRPNVDDQVTDLLWMVRVAPLCSPVVARAAPGRTLADFVAAHELLHVKLAGEQRDLLWANFAQQSGHSIATDGGLAFDTAISAAHYAMAAGGVFLGDVDLFAAEIADGRLVMPFPTMIEDGFGYYLKLHAEDLDNPAIAVFRSWIIKRFAAIAG